MTKGEFTNNLIYDMTGYPDAGTWLRCTYTEKHLQAGSINERKIFYMYRTD